MVTAGILPFRENSHGRAGNRTRDHMISRQRLWPLDHEAGLVHVLSHKFWQVCQHSDVLQILKFLQWNLLASHLNEFILGNWSLWIGTSKPLTFDTISYILSTLKIKHDTVGNNGHLLPVLWYDPVSVTSPVSTSAWQMTSPRLDAFDPTLPWK